MEPNSTVIRMKFWGVRGSIPTPGKSTIRYGGNTPSVEVRLDDGTLIILDAGSGIRNLGEDLLAKNEPVTAFLLITHPHWDHIQGFPFFRPVWIPSTTLTVIGPERPEKSLNEIIADQMNRIYFPVQLHDVKAKVSFKPLRGEDTFSVGGARVKALYVNHPGYTVGYKIMYKGKSLVYISDNEPFDKANIPMLTSFEKKVISLFEADGNSPNKRIVEFCRNVDVLIHDSTYFPKELSERVGWGHSDYLFALKLASDASAKRLYLFHHDHMHSDDDVDEIFRQARYHAAKMNVSVVCEAAVEGETVLL